MWRLGHETRVCIKTLVRILLFDSVFPHPIFNCPWDPSYVTAPFATVLQTLVHRSGPFQSACNWLFRATWVSKSPQTAIFHDNKWAKRCQNVAREGVCIASQRPAAHKHGFPPLHCCCRNFDRVFELPLNGSVTCTVSQRTFHKQQPHTTWNTLYAPHNTQHTTCNTQNAIHCMKHTMCYTQDATHVMENITCNTQHAAWEKQHTRMCRDCTHCHGGE